MAERERKDAAAASAAALCVDVGAGEHPIAHEDGFAVGCGDGGAESESVAHP